MSVSRAQFIPESVITALHPEDLLCLLMSLGCRKSLSLTKCGGAQPFSAFFS